jgi:hypothetical protein
MRKQSMQPSVTISAALGVALTCASPGFAADTHVIGIGADNFSWTYKDKVSAPNNPLAVDDLKIGDTVEVQIPDGSLHGFVTIKRSAGPPPTATVDKSPVLACGEDASSKPNAVLRELDCGAASKFGVAFSGSLRLEVMNTFKDPVDFYCVIHKNGMPGVLKLVP